MLFFKNGIFNLISLFLATSLGPSSPIEMYSGRKWTFFKIFEIQIFMPIFKFSSKNWTFWCVYRPDYDKVHQTMIFHLLCEEAPELENQHLFQIYRHIHTSRALPDLGRKTLKSLNVVTPLSWFCPESIK